MYCSLWLCRNTLIFEINKLSFLDYLQILHTLRTSWTILEKPSIHGLVSCSGISTISINDQGSFYQGT